MYSIVVTIKFSRVDRMAIENCKTSHKMQFTCWIRIERPSREMSQDNQEFEKYAKLTEKNQDRPRLIKRMTMADSKAATNVAVSV